MMKRIITPFFQFPPSKIRQNSSSSHHAPPSGVRPGIQVSTICTLGWIPGLATPVALDRYETVAPLTPRITGRRKK